MRYEEEVERHLGALDATLMELERLSDSLSLRLAELRRAKERYEQAPISRNKEVLASELTHLDYFLNDLGRRLYNEYGNSIPR